MNNFLDYDNEISKLLDAANVSISSIKPSEWCEANRMMTSDVSPIPGMFRYGNSPYTREIVDCLSNDHPSRTIAIMKGAQIGFSTGVIEAGIGWIVSQNPGNILFLVGHEDLISDAMNKVDRMIDSSSIRHFIRSNSNRAKNNKSGDTDQRKDYPGGYLKLGIANHKYLRNISMQYGFIDDFESMRSSTKESGSTQEMIEQRFAAYAKKMKLFYISTPELKATSNIHPVYLKGDQRKWHVPCPCCGEFIVLEWQIKIENTNDKFGGITYELNEENELIPESVGYTCQKCMGFFDESVKTEIIKLGKYIPTAKAVDPTFISFHISALYGSSFMYGWTKYVRQYLEACPPNKARNEKKWQTFQNLVLGEPYEPTGISIKANQLQQNCRPYTIGTIPEKLSLADGNGNIILITLGSDMNGLEDDARLDYEIVAHSESGATYSITHGSIGTFVNRDKESKRERWTYRMGAERSVWTEFEKILNTTFVNDSSGKNMRIFLAGLDSGVYTNYAYQFANTTNQRIVLLKGDDDAKPISAYSDQKTFRPSKERNDLYLTANNYTKDLLSENMQLKWNPEFNSVQPYGFMNFPFTTDEKYKYDNYFSHFEAEHKIIDDKGMFRWEKKSNRHQNHLFDCRLYAMVVKDIFLTRIFKEYKIINGTWADYVNLLKNKK